MVQLKINQSMPKQLPNILIPAPNDDFENQLKFIGAQENDIKFPNEKKLEEKLTWKRQFANWAKSMNIVTVGNPQSLFSTITPWEITLPTFLFFLHHACPE